MPPEWGAPPGLRSTYCNTLRPDLRTRDQSQMAAPRAAAGQERDS